MKKYDCLIVGAGVYGLYGALKLATKHKKVLVIDCELSPFLRASYVNQARLHMGYHYPRSLHTAIKCSTYFDRFLKDYTPAIIQNYKKIYAISEKFGMCSANNFEKFCLDANIPCFTINPENYFNVGVVDACYETKEYTIDMRVVQDILLEKIKEYPNIELQFNRHITQVEKHHEYWQCTLNDDNSIVQTPFLLNASYASLNAVAQQFGFPPLPIKFELAEMVLCTAPPALKSVGLTLMDGPFFSVMPFNTQGLFSMSAVRYTPHQYSNEDLPQFTCQKDPSFCRPKMIGNCSTCPYRPPSAWNHMKQLAQKYLRPEFIPQFHESILTIKALMKSSSTSDSRPVIIDEPSSCPRFVSVLGGKINTIYELDEVLL